jgi:FixJ family two-component response regulator
MMQANRICVIGVVDDERQVLESLEDLLESAGYAVRPFASAHDCFLADALSHIDCLVSDIAMPGMDGIDLLRVAHAHYPRLPVIMVTANRDPGVLIAAGDAGARFVLVKPCSDELLRALRHVLSN